VTLFMPADYTGWQNRAMRRGLRLPPGEYDCEVCNQPCLQQGINIENPSEITERFCSNFCSALANHKNNNDDEPS
jgi:hypothetical protein